MRRSYVLPVAVTGIILLTTGCVSENRGKLEDTCWTSDSADVRIRTPMGGKQTVHVPAGYMELDFKQDGTLFYIIDSKLYRGKYSLNSGSTVTFHLEEPLAGMKTHAETIIVEGNRLTMKDTDGTTVTFSKIP